MRTGNVTTASLKGSERLFRKMCSCKIVYFEDSFEEMAFKYVPGEPGKLGKYNAKYYGVNEYEIDYSASYLVFEAELEGLEITKARYDNYHLIKYY